MIRQLILALALAPSLLRAEGGASVVVLYNSNMAASKSLAEYYAEKRSVPAAQIIGLPLPEREAISREEYRRELADPFVRKLEELKLLTFRTDNRTNSSGKVEEIRSVDQAKIRYAALCYGVPVKIEQDNRIQEPESEHAPAHAKRNEASVDSELALVPFHHTRTLLNGPLVNQFYAFTNASLMTPRNGILLVARLDGPTPEIARGLVDKALIAERDGLWGRAYIDTRAISSGEYKVGDDMFRASAKTLTRNGFETVVDDKPEVLPAGFPMPQIAFYGGWYEFNVAGAFTPPKIEFMPGAFAYHLHSYSAQFVRNATDRWVGPLLARGATCTMGTTEEPFLSGTPDIAVFVGRWLFEGASFAEAAYLSQQMLSWQTTVIGDPLYRPFARKPQDQHEALEKTKNDLLEWSILRVANINLATALPPAKAIQYLRGQPLIKTSALLNEKLGFLLKAEGKWIDAMDPLERALTLNPSPQQRLRIALTLTTMQVNLGRGRQAYEILQGLIRDFPDYPDKIRIYQKLLPLADQFGKPGDAADYEKALNVTAP